MLDKDDMNFIKENYEWLRELVREPEHSYKAEKFCNVNGCSELVAKEDWGRWIICPKHKEMCNSSEGYMKLQELGYKNESS